MELLNFPIDPFKVFLMVLIRVSVVLFLFPVFSSAMIPNLVKAGLAMVIALALVPAVPVNPARFPVTVAEALIFGVSELFMGSALALSIRIFLAAVELAGEMIGFQMGFSIINVLDPQSGIQVSIMGQIGNLIVLVIFLALNGHHALINGMVESFRVVDVGFLSLKKEFMYYVLTLMSDMFVIAVQMGAPAIVALLFTSAGFGIAAKFVPQMNILMAAFPVKIVVGLVFFGLSIQLMAIITRTYLTRFPSIVSAMLKWMGGG